MVRINWIQPYTNTYPLNLGGEYNRIISMLPDDEWIGITDHDAMFLRPDSKAQITEVVQRHGHEFDVFGVVTNRLNKTHQLHNNVCSSEGDINHHVNIANDRHSQYYGQVEKTTINLAGLCLVFSKSTWQRVDGFKEHSIALDRQFTDAVQKTGGKIGIMTGVYLFHLYRWGQPNPGKYIDHLI